MGGHGSGRKRKSAAAAAIAPAIETAPSTKNGLLGLPALEIPGAEKNPDAEKARAALESAAPPEQAPAQLPADTPEKTAAAVSSAGVAPAPEKKKIPAAAARENLSGSQYKSLKHEQLRTLLAETKNELAELRTKNAALEIVAHSELAGTLENAISETAHAIAGGAAALWGEHMKLQGDQASRLGKAWAPVVAHYMPDVVQHAPLVGAIVATSSIVLEKYATHKALVALAIAQPAAREAA